MSSEFENNILLTGAGFTKNVGGLLASEMWSHIFNLDQIQKHPNLKKLLYTDCNYESVYHKVISGEYSTEEKNAISEAILSAYDTLDDIVRNWTFTVDAQFPMNIYGVNEFIGNLLLQEGKKGLFFTLNQDLFIERHYSNLTKQLSYPYVSRCLDEYHRNMKMALNRKDFVSTPSEKDLQNNQGLMNNTINYIKLHGSYGWLSQSGSNNYVIGVEKEEQIAMEPLLSKYAEIFIHALSGLDKKLLIIGYGFGDEHINKAIANAIKDYKLKIYILSPSSNEYFIDKIKKLDESEVFLKGLSGYFKHGLLDLFPKDQSKTDAISKILEKFQQR
ncbi:MAG: hypothetical protein BMS9Abin25_0502 [Gammaproteobacteria bacterium]|nr:MAG: hypothetical protein BMS9Abin25_0502 [Gammaproteobacteria bacterium]